MNAPLLDAPALLDAVEHERSLGRSIAFANGIFDLLHVGHIRYLQAAAATADILVVGVNGDGSTRKLKGEGRPIVPELERAEIVAAIRGVSYVILFEDASPGALIARLRPDIHCKGTDYTAESVPEGEIVRAYGGRVLIVGDPKEHSTTEMIERRVKG